MLARRGPERGERVPVLLVADDRELLLGRRIAERDAHQEAVELSLRQREVPSCSIGLSVASRRNGRGRGRVSPSTVTCTSAIGSRSADCVFGIARFTSSSGTTFAKIGPGRNSKSRVFWL
jgi:hypothetical protein